MPAEPQHRFRFLTQLNDAPPEIRRYSGKSHGFPKRVAQTYFASSRLADRLVRALLDAQALQFKEILESFEFYGHIRRPLRAREIVDLCCGHGLVGILFALFDREVERVTLLDSNTPKSYQRLLAVATRLGPWVGEKVCRYDLELAGAQEHLRPEVSIAAAHACGNLTDVCLQLAIDHRAAVAVMPCCCHPVKPGAPSVLGVALGKKLAVDIHRTYELTSAGHEVLWRYLPEDITPMNRVIIGKRPGDGERG